jgi:hypothetical protein
MNALRHLASPRFRRAGARPPPWAHDGGAQGPALRDHLNRVALRVLVRLIPGVFGP